MCRRSGTCSHGVAPRVDCVNGWCVAWNPQSSASTVNSMGHVCAMRFQTWNCSGAHAPSTRHTCPSAQCAVSKQGARPSAAWSAEVQSPSAPLLAPLLAATTRHWKPAPQAPAPALVVVVLHGTPAPHATRQPPQPSN